MKINRRCSEVPPSSFAVRLFLAGANSIGITNFRTICTKQRIDSAG
jgi:hypothetical protein